MTLKIMGETAVPVTVKRVFLIALAAVIFISATAFATPPVQYNVCITDGLKVTEVISVRTNAEDVLEDVGIILNENRGDTIKSSEFCAENGTAQITIERGVKVTVKNCNGSRKSFYCSGTVGDALEKSGVKVEKGHRVNYSDSEPLENGMVIEVYDIYSVVLKCDGKKTKKKVSAGNVGEALECLGVTLEGEDFVSPEADTELKNGIKITVHRVEVKKRKIKETIPFKIDYTYTEKLYKNQSKVVTEGKNGKKVTVYNDYYVDGKLSRSEVVSEKTTKPVNKVLNIGTKINPTPATLPTSGSISQLAVPSYVKIGGNGLPQNYKSVINAKATAYSGGGITSTGKAARTGYIAVDPNEIPYGTEMYIVSADGRYVYGYCIAADTGGFIYDVDWTVDLYMNSESQCVQWGRRDIIIYIL